MIGDQVLSDGATASEVVTLVSTAALFSLLYLAGHAVLGLIMDVGRPRSGPFEPVAGAGYGVIGLGPASVLILSSILRGLGLYRPWTTIACLIGLVIIATVGSGSFRRQWSGVRENVLPAAVYLACLVAMWLIFPPQTMPLIGVTSVYLLQGFDLFSTADPMQWPYFGELFRMPVMYVTHTIGTVFGLFSAGDPSRYFLYGLYWIDIALGPLVPLGLYLFLRGHVPRGAAALIAFLFCFWILGPRTWSIRGESLGWISGLAFLIFGREILSMLSAREERGHPLRLSIAMAMCYFSMVVTHGVSAMISTFFFTGLGIAGLLGHPRRLPALAVAKPVAAFSGTIAAMAAIYFVLFCGIYTPHQIMFNNDLPPVAGEPDPALLIEQQLGPSIPLTMRPIVASAPYTNPLRMAAAAALLPIAAIFRRGFDQIDLQDFPFEAYIRLKSLPLAESGSYILLLSLCLVFYIACLWRKTHLTYVHLVIASITVEVLSLVFVVYLDLQSFSIYPLASTRRLYPYIRFFYGVIVVLTLLEIGRKVLARGRPSDAVLIEPPSSSSADLHVAEGNVVGSSLRRSWRTKLSPFSMEDAAAVMILYAAVLFATVTAATGQSWDIGWMSRRVAATVVERSADLLGPSSSARTADGAIGQILASDAAAARDRSNLVGAFDFLRHNTTPGEWVYSNIISDNQFWYLSGGRLSLYEGSAMYQVYALQRRAAAHMADFHAFASDGDFRRLAGYHVKLLMFYRHGTCRVASCYGFDAVPTQLCVFDRPGIEPVFLNADYIIYRVEQSGQVPPLLTANTSCAPPYQYGTEINFTQDGDNPYRGAGWSTPESVGTWTDGTSAELRFKLSSAQSDLTLTAVYTPYLPPSHSAPIVTVKSGGAVVARWTTATGNQATQCAVIPAQTVGPGGELNVTLGIDGPPSPIELHWVDDPRHLGILVRSMTIDSTPDAVARCRQRGEATVSHDAVLKAPVP